MQWLRLWTAQAAHAAHRVYSRVHVTTDPVCRFYRAPAPQSRLDACSRGWSCQKCLAVRK